MTRANYLNKVMDDFLKFCEEKEELVKNNPYQYLEELKTFFGTVYDEGYESKIKFLNKIETLNEN